MEKNVFISCITPTFNRANLLKNAIESTLVQTYPYWEMIIVDDNSTDNTEEVVRSYIQKDRRVKYFKNPGKGGNAARNHGIRHAKGKYVAFLDDDDQNLPHRFESQLKAVQRSGIGFILSGYQAQDEKGRIISNNSNGLWAKGAGITSRWFIEKELLFKAGLFDEEMPAMQENEFSYRIANHCTFANHSDIVVIRRLPARTNLKAENALAGRIMLINKHKNNMHPMEAAWWYYTIAMQYCKFENNKESLKNLRKAADLDNRGIYKYAYQYAKFAFNYLCCLRTINCRLLNFICNYKFPKLLNHPIIV